MKATVHSIEVADMTATEIAVATANDIMVYVVDVSYGDGEPETVQFVGTRHGSPGAVYLIAYPGKEAPRLNPYQRGDRTEETQIKVLTPERFGVRFNEDWIKAFFSEEVAG